ncbi:hypothetical protein HY090_02520 [Candidatus Kaiserbacteria bacterium]|nr:hypothetical protein [Candidatus Kaiserbacteria bacterium]
MEKLLLVGKRLSKHLWPLSEHNKNKRKAKREAKRKKTHEELRKVEAAIRELRKERRDDQISNVTKEPELRKLEKERRRLERKLHKQRLNV